MTKTSSISLDALYDDNSNHVTTDVVIRDRTSTLIRAQALSYDFAATPMATEVVVICNGLHNKFVESAKVGMLSSLQPIVKCQCNSYRLHGEHVQLRQLKVKGETQVRKQNSKQLFLLTPY